MSYTIIKSTLSDLVAFRTDPNQNLDWSSVFVLPDWLKVWWESFGAGYELFIRTVKEGNHIIGIAPLMVKDNTAYFIGSVDVCDYQDFIIIPGKESAFFKTVLDELKRSGIKMLDLKHVRPDSTVMISLPLVAEVMGLGMTTEQQDVSYEMGLPADFEEYLESLTTKQRHEVRRKLRRLNEEGNIEYRFEEKGPGLDAALDNFFRMFVESRQDKAVFLTDRMKKFFRSLVHTMAGIGLLKLGILELDKKPVAEILCFDYNDCIYLYNSGYDPKYVSLSAGLLSKVLTIKDSIEKGKKKFDFLKGTEPYKAHLGGNEVPLFQCRIGIQ